MGMTVTACYIFLAVVLAPALEAGGLEPAGGAPLHPLLGHGLLHHAAGGARRLRRRDHGGRERRSRPGCEAMRLGGVIYFVPFFFVLNPALIGQAPALRDRGRGRLGADRRGADRMALQGYVSLLGPLPVGVAGLALRLLMFFGGLFFAMPHTGAVGMSYLTTAIIGLGLAALPLGAAFLAGRRQAALGWAPIDKSTVAKDT